MTRWVPLKRWLFEEARRTGLTTNAIRSRIDRQREFYYPRLQMRRVNARVVFVEVRANGKCAMADGKSSAASYGGQGI